MDPQIIAIIAAAIKSAVDLGPLVIKGIEDAEPFAEAIVNHILGKEPSEVDVERLEARLADISAQLQAALPPEQEDDI